MVLSIWHGDACMATHQMSMDDVPDLVKVLANALVVPAADVAADPRERTLSAALSR